MTTNLRRQFIWGSYDPSWLVELARKQHSEKSWLLDTLAKCTHASRKSTGLEGTYMTCFIDPLSATWDFKSNLRLNEWSEGEIILDIMKDGSVGAAEIIIFPAMTEIDGRLDEELIQRADKNIKR
jgi:hypothetical protein